MILAIGQVADLEFLAGTVKTTPQGTIEVNASLETSRRGVFAAGDVVSGPATVIEAIAGGRWAAADIDRYLGGDGDIDVVLVPAEEPAPRLGREESTVVCLRAMTSSTISSNLRKRPNIGFAPHNLPPHPWFGSRKAAAFFRRRMEPALAAAKTIAGRMA